MEVVITYSEVVERCKMLSSHEAREAVDADGEKMYSIVKITDNEKTLITTFAKAGAKVIESLLSSIMTEEGDYESETELKWFMSDDAQRRGTNGSRSFKRSVQEALCVYCMGRWLENKLPQQSVSYNNMFKDLSQSVVRIAMQKRKPSRPS